LSAKKLLIIDGYNVIHRIPELKPSLEAGLENARTRLALQVSAWNHDHPAYECVIVFDGDESVSGGGESFLAGVRCVFSRKAHGADARIVGFVRESGGRAADITVVSDDNFVGNNCRAHGASVQPASFIMTRKAPPAKRQADIAAGGKGLDRKAAAEIDRELRKKFGL
jgi:predicted RNA-binding protein with PIN domain